MPYDRAHNLLKIRYVMLRIDSLFDDLVDYSRYSGAHLLFVLTKDGNPQIPCASHIAYRISHVGFQQENHLTARASQVESLYVPLFFYPTRSRWIATRMLWTPITLALRTRIRCTTIKQSRLDLAYSGITISYQKRGFLSFLFQRRCSQLAPRCRSRSQRPCVS